MIQLDERGKQCPLPVIDAKKALEKATAGEYVQVTVDNEIAVQNLKKLADHKGYHSDSMKLASNRFIVNILKAGSNPGGAVQGGPGLADSEESGLRVEVPKQQGAVPEVRTAAETACVQCIPDARRKGMVVVLASDRMGEPDETLGKILMKGFVYALSRQDVLPETVLLYNGGAKLSTEGSEALQDLKELEAQGVEIMTCGTCLKHLQLEEKLAVGTVSNMYEIVEKMTAANLIVRP